MSLSELNLELGKSANPSEVEQLTIEFANRWKLPESKPNNPFTLMVGGFQGSGKTTTLELLKDDLSLIIISPDELRYNLFARNYPFSDYFVALVNATKFNLLRKALNTGYNIAIDQLTNHTRIDIVKSIIQEQFPDYKLLVVFLDASEATLIERVSNRPNLQGKYKGTVDELKSSLKKHGKQDLSIYDLVLNTGNLSPLQTAKMIRDHI